jgi:tetratricopeptide (TPR) repeat protein
LKKLVSIILLLLSTTLTVLGNSPEKVSLDSIDYYLSQQSYYDRQKEDHINQIKNEIGRNKDNDQIRYTLYTDLFEEYRSYIYDSAYVCVEKLLEVSKSLNDHDKITSSVVKMGFCYLSSGLFKEAFDILMEIDVTGCSNETKIDYYTHKSRLYYDLADYNNSHGFRKQYEEIGNQIIDSAIVLLPIESPRFWATVGLKRMKSDNNRNALDAFQKMIDTRNYSEHDLAIATSSIAYLQLLQGKTKEAEYFLIQAAISDIKSSTKETVALRNLAQLLYEKGDISHAVVYIRHAMEDASFYNARHRQLEIGNILPIIEGERMNTIEKQRDRIILFFLCISVLMVLLIVALYIIWKSLRRLNQAKQIIQDANDHLTAMNNDLTEVNKIKDEYIGYFFSQNSEFIEKIDAFQKWVSRKVFAKQYDDLKIFPKNMDIQKERENLYAHFDQTFLKLFPDFVNRFNDLLKPGEQIQLKKGELLNTDLRIYALIRLGINDNEKIAQFLGYSLNTIYTYKTKIKNKALNSNEEFKQKIMEIKSI